MPAISSFGFNGFTLRPTSATTDWQLAHDWQQADPHHRGGRTDFWLEQRPGVESYLLLKGNTPVFFLRMARLSRFEVELHIQFSPELPEPDAEAERKRQMMLGMVQGLVWIEKVLSNLHVERISFTSRSPRLTKFCVRRLGFKQDGERLEKDLPSGERAANVRSYQRTDAAPTGADGLLPKRDQ
jgi:hypothetical protein